LAFQNAELNRDKKKRNRPYKPDEFYFYQTEDDRNLPEPKYGAAAYALIEKGLFPSWALFVYKDLKERAGNAMAPELLCFSCENAIILAPSVEDGKISGMLIAGNECSGKVLEMSSPCGKKVTVRMPPINGRYIADEDAEIRLLY
jgi:hypothetical protein